MIYELTTLLFSPGTLRQTLPKIRTLLGGDASLLGIFTVDVGNINELIVLRRYVRPEDLALSLPGQRSIYDDVGEGLLRVRVEPLLQLSYVPDPEPGRYGQLYELRAYKLLPEGLDKMVAAWQEPLAQRVRLSPVLMAAHSIDGDGIRFFQLWVYADAAHRAVIRQQAAASGVWPPPGGSGRWESQLNMFLIPDESSPLK